MSARTKSVERRGEKVGLARQSLADQTAKDPIMIVAQRVLPLSGSIAATPPDDRDLSSDSLRWKRTFVSEIDDIFG